jgi:muramoyltetrapeptide carboxypeptidase LdcA involved in peptidoglycan recycling
MLSQLRLAGVMDAVAGVVVGNFSAKNAAESQEIQRVLRE